METGVPPGNRAGGASCRVPSPKQGSAVTGRAGWYPYYAGYCPAFVRTVLESSGLPPGSLVLDPWNGAGTTTQVASDLGFPALGFDINPCMALVATAHLLDSHVIPNLHQRLNDILRRFAMNGTDPEPTSDPLRKWLQPESVGVVRRLESAIRATFESGTYSGVAQFSGLRGEISFCFLVLFRSLREILSVFRATNPTWLKVARSEGELVSVDRGQLKSQFERQFQRLLGNFDFDIQIQTVKKECAVQVAVADSRNLPVDSQVADIVISSPPYCTRIDYAIATSVELAVLRFDPGGRLRGLRDQMIGTSTIQPSTPSVSTTWGPTCISLLTKIFAHHTKASQTYYYKTHVQYFAGLYRSLLELDRCVRRSGHCVLVAQDSYYKDVHNDLPLILQEMAGALGWTLHCRRDFPAYRNMARRNGAHVRTARPRLPLNPFFGSVHPDNRTRKWPDREQRAPTSEGPQFSRRSMMRRKARRNESAGYITE